MIDRSTKAFRFAASTFVVSTTIGQVLAIDDWLIKGLILVPNLLAWAYVIDCNRRYQHFNPTKHQITKVGELLKSTQKIRYRHVKDEAELYVIWKCDTLAYGEENFDFDQFLSWWIRYPFSPFALFEGNEILGSCGIWPLTAEVFARVRDSIIPEEMITHLDIVSPEQVSECRHWYFAGIPMRTERDIFHEYLAESLRDWVSRLGDHRLIHIVSLRYTKNDEDLYRVLGFTQYKIPMKKGMHPVYYRSFEGRDEIKEYILALESRRDESGKDQSWQ
jgi:hypothetical protein